MNTEYELHLLDGQVITALEGQSFYWIKFDNNEYEDLGAIHGYTMAWGHLGMIEKGVIHVTEEFGKLDTSVATIPIRNVILISKIGTNKSEN